MYQMVRVGTSLYNDFRRHGSLSAVKSDSTACSPMDYKKEAPVEGSL